MDFAAAITNPPQPVCIGVRLRPFSLGHKLLLQTLDCAFVVGGVPTYADLIAGAFVCAHSWEENQKLLRSRFRKWLRLRLWGLLAGRFDIEAQAVVFLNYVRDSEDVPPPKRGRGPVRELASDWDTMLYRFLRSIGFSHVEAMNTPLIVGNLLLISSLEESGTMEFKSRRDYERDDALLRAEREAEESGVITE